MKKIAKDYNVLTDAQVDSMMLALEAAYTETGSSNVLKVLDIITEKNTPDNKTIISPDQCPVCGKRHPLVRQFGYCGKCASLMYD